MATTNTGSANSPYNNVVVETVSGEIKAGPHNTNSANLKIAVQAHTHSLDSMVGWISLRSAFRPPDTGDSTNRWRWVCGTATGSVTSGSGTVQITFATDADQGDPAFTTAPRVTAIVSASAGGFDAVVTRFASAITTTAAYFLLSELNGGTSTGSVTIHWMAYGKIA